MMRDLPVVSGTGLSAHLLLSMVLMWWTMKLILFLLLAAAKVAMARVLGPRNIATVLFVLGRSRLLKRNLHEILGLLRSSMTLGVVLMLAEQAMSQAAGLKTTELIALGLTMKLLTLQSHFGLTTAMLAAVLAMVLSVLTAIMNGLFRGIQTMGVVADISDTGMILCMLLTGPLLRLSIVTRMLVVAVLRPRHIMPVLLLVAEAFV